MTYFNFFRVHIYMTRICIALALVIDMRSHHYTFHNYKCSFLSSCSSQKEFDLLSINECVVIMSELWRGH